MLEDLLEISRLESQLDSLFAQLQELARLRSGRRPDVWRPSVDIIETPAEMAYIFELPGVGLEDVVAEVRRRILVVRGTKHPPKVPEGGGSFICIERRYGDFACEVLLDSNVETCAVKATLKNGELKVSFPRSSKEEDGAIRLKIDG